MFREVAVVVFDKIEPTCEHFPFSGIRNWIQTTEVVPFFKNRSACWKKTLIETIEVFNTQKFEALELKRISKNRLFSQKGIFKRILRFVQGFVHVWNGIVEIKWKELNRFLLMRSKIDKIRVLKLIFRTQPIKIEKLDYVGKWLEVSKVLVEGKKGTWGDKRVEKNLVELESWRKESRHCL